MEKDSFRKKEPYGKKGPFKYFLGYNGDDTIRPLCIKLPQMIGYVKHFDGNKTMSFKINDNRLLKEYTKICEKVSILMNIEFDSEPISGDNDKYIRAKIKSYGDKVNTNFKAKKYQKKNESNKCLSMVMLDFSLIVSEKYFPQTLLKECRYEIKKTKMENLINDNLDSSSSDDETDNESENETEFDNNE